MRRTFTKAIIVLSILLFIFSVSAAFAAPSINLPTDPVDAEFNHPGPNSYWKITLSSVPSGYDVTNGVYVGWCVDQTNTIGNGATLYDVMLYSSYDTANNPYKPNDDWPEVNHIINNPQGDWQEVQDAIWYFIDGGILPPIGSDARAMVDAAEDDFVPLPGQKLAVVVYKAGKQVTFIEVDIPINGVIPEYPIGPILGSVSFVVALGLFKCRHALPAVFRFKRD